MAYARPGIFFDTCNSEVIHLIKQCVVEFSQKSITEVGFAITLFL